MDPTNPTVRWSAFELHRRMEKAQTAAERSAVRRDIDRARRDPAFRERLAEIAESGRFATGPHQAAQLGLAGASLAPFLPVVGSALGPVGAGLGLLGAAGLGAYGAANIGEAFQRRQEGLPWMGQAGFGAADVVTAPFGASHLFRRLASSAAKAAPQFGPVLRRRGEEASRILPGQKTPTLVSRQGERVATSPGPQQAGRPLDQIFEEGSDVGGMLRALEREDPTIFNFAPKSTVRTSAATAQTPEASRVTVAGKTTTLPTPDPVTGKIKSSIFPTEEVGRYDPTTARWIGGEGLESLPSSVRNRILKERARRDSLRGGRLRPRQDTPPFESKGLVGRSTTTTPRPGTVDVVDPATGRITGRRLAQQEEGPSVTYTDEAFWGQRKTAAKQALETANAENLAAKSAKLDPIYDAKALQKLEEAVKFEDRVNAGRESLRLTYTDINNTISPFLRGLRQGIFTRTKTGGAVPPRAATNVTPKAPVQTGDDIKSEADKIVREFDEAANVATTLEDTVLHTVKGSPRIRDLSDSQLESILARRQTGRTGPQLAGFSDEAEAVERVLAERKAAFQARTGVTAAVDEADKVVTQVKTAEEVTDVGVAGTVDDLEWGGFRTAIEDMSNAELKLSGLNAISHMIVRGSEDLFKAFKTVPFKKTRKGTMSQGIQRGGLLRQFLRGAPEQHGSSPAYLFGHRPRGGSPEIKELFDPLEEIGTAQKKGVTQILTGGPGGKSSREKGPRVLETWFAGQGKIVGKQAWKQEKALNIQRVQDYVKSLDEKGIKTSYTVDMIGKAENALTPTELVIHDQAVAMSVMANRAEVLGSLLSRKIGKPGRIPEFGGGGEDVLTQFTGAFESFMKEGAHKQRPQILAAINQFNDDIAGLLAAITAAEMMAIAGDPRATIGQPT